MSTYITQSQTKFEVSNRKLDAAYEWLKKNTHDEWSSASYRDYTCIFYPEEDGFGGSTAYGWQEMVEEFMEEFCLPKSYATFREDEEFAYSMAYLNDMGQVEWDSVPWDNPFIKRCEELEEA